MNLSLIIILFVSKWAYKDVICSKLNINTAAGETAQVAIQSQTILYK